MRGGRGRVRPLLGVSVSVSVWMALLLAAWPAPSMAATPDPGLSVDVSSGAHGSLPQAARLTYRVRVRNDATVEASGVTVEQVLPSGVIPVGVPDLTGADGRGCLVFGSAGPDGASRFRASCEVGSLSAGAAAVMVVRARVDRATCGELRTDVAAAIDGARAATATLEDRVACTCRVRLARGVVGSGAVGSEATVRLTVSNPGPHPLRYELRGHGHRLAAGVLPGGALRHHRQTLRLARARTVERVVVVARAPDGRSCRAAGTVVIAGAAPPASPGDGDGRHPGGTAFTGPPGPVPVALAAALLAIGVVSLAMARRRSGG